MTAPGVHTIVARLDGILVPPTLPFLRPDDLGVLRGDGVFEATLAVAGVPRDLPEHLQRMQRSASLLDLAIPSPPEWQPAIQAVLAGWGGGRQMVLRLFATRGPENGGDPTCWAIGSAPADKQLLQRTTGTSVVLLARGFTGVDVAGYRWLLPGAKSLSYAVNMAAYRYAASQGADDVIFVGTDGTVLEGPTSGVVAAFGRTLVTPPLEGILDSITVRRLLAVAEGAGWQTGVRKIGPDELHTADGVWLASSIRLLTPVTAIDGRSRPIGAATAELAALLDVPSD